MSVVFPVNFKLGVTVVFTTLPDQFVIDIAGSCSQGDVSSAYSSAVPGDTVVVPEGDCTWDSMLSVSKERVWLQGAGIDKTIIRLGGFNGPAVQINENEVRISGFTFSCALRNTSNRGVIRVGNNDSDPSYRYGDFRIDSNRFIDCDQEGKE